MSTLMQVGLSNAAVTGVLALAALAVGRFCRRPALAHCLWLLVLVKLLTPPLYRPRLPWLPEASPEQGAAVQGLSLPPPGPRALTYFVLPPASKPELREVVNLRGAPAAMSPA